MPAKNKLAYLFTSLNQKDGAQNSINDSDAPANEKQSLLASKRISSDEPLSSIRRKITEESYS